MKIKVLHSETQKEIKQINLAHVLREGSCFVGRSQASGLSLDSPNVSRLHGKFSYHDGQYYFCDLGSSNGSFIQGELAVTNQEYLLQPGQIIRLGDFVLLLEAIPESSEVLPATVIGNLDATVISAYTNPVEQDDLDDQQPVIEAEVVSSALVKVTPVEMDYSLQAQTAALFAAIHQRIVSELKAAGNLSRDTYLRAIYKARASIEQERLIDPERFEQEAEKHWRSLARTTSALGAQIGLATAKGAVHLGQRLGSAAKAAWGDFVAYRPSAKQIELTEQSDVTDETGDQIEKPDAELNSTHQNESNQDNL